MNFIIQLLIALAFAVIAYMIMPKPKQPKPASASQMDGPTAEAGRPIPVVFGTITVTEPNYLWYGDKATGEYQVDA